MYGDTDALRALARQLRERADALRGEADGLAGRTSMVSWQGLAAEALRGRVAHQAGALREAATAHERAASAVEAHAGTVEERQELIARIERRVQALLADARDRLAAVGSVLPDPLDLRVLRLQVPPPGHLDWLRVDLPGVP